MKNLFKNVLIALLVSWIAFLLLPAGSTTQLIIPMMMAMFGSGIAYCAYDSNEQ